MNEYGPEATDVDSVTTDSVHFVVVDAPTGTGEIVCTTVAVTSSETVISMMDVETPTAPVCASVSGCVTYTVTVTMLGDEPVLVTVLPTTEVYNSDDGVTVVALVIVT